MSHPAPVQPVSSRPFLSRVHNSHEAIERYGEPARNLFHALERGDPVADALAERLDRCPREWSQVNEAIERGLGSDREASRALQDFIAEAETVPEWVDFKRIERAGKVFFRTGLAGGIVLGAKSLCHGYCSPAGNKPLIMTGRLDGPAMGMRLAETSKFVVQTCSPHGLRPYAAGFSITLKVRLMHAVVRRLLCLEPGWDAPRLGLPINQHDMLGTALLFSLSFVEGVQTFGFDVSDGELEDYLHLWRYSSHLMGVEDTLYPRDAASARDLAAIILLTQGAPDHDARRLVDALVTAPKAQADGFWRELGARAQTALGYGFCRSLLGPELADALALPRTALAHSPGWARPWVARVEKLRRLSPRLEQHMLNVGQRYWQEAIQQGLQGRQARFRASERLARRPSGDPHQKPD